MVESFWNKCMKTYKLYSAHFLSTAELAWQAALKKAKVNLELLIDINMLLIIEKGIREGICAAIHWYAKANKKDYDKNMKDHD